MPRGLGGMRDDHAEAAAVAEEVLDLELLLGHHQHVVGEPGAVDLPEPRVVEGLHVDPADLRADLRPEPSHLDRGRHGHILAPAPREVKGRSARGDEAVYHVAEDARDVVVVAIVREATAEGDRPDRKDRPTAWQLCVGHVRAYHARGPLTGGRGEVAQKLLEDHYEARAMPFRAGD